MELQHSFEVPVGIDTAWESLLDMEQVAACFPGATLTSADGKTYTGSVKVKLGPIQLTYAGSAEITSADEAKHHAVIEASGKAARSGSTASMTVNATAAAKADDATEVTLDTDLTITGRPAQFGRGVMAEVGNKILGKFADCLAATLATSDAADSGTTNEPSDDAPDTAAPAANDASDTAASATEAETGKDNTSESQSRHSATYTRSPEPIDLLDSAGAPVAKRLAPVVAGLLAVVFVGTWWRRRRARRG